jgi:hypothetical protein
VEAVIFNILLSTRDVPTIKAFMVAPLMLRRSDPFDHISVL